MCQGFQIGVDITNQGKRDYKSKHKLQIEAGITNRGKRGCKSWQELQIGAEQPAYKLFTLGLKRSLYVVFDIFLREVQ